ncbi:helix-turn-helix transcriptional regulator [Georgenia sp. AZ-5]|uniref:helix-turn-helix transcriptional regulator n=1 Tax=Georgenia sp. AZ-5 TaxID=3367526 RepID=UPI00375467C6
MSIQTLPTDAHDRPPVPAVVAHLTGVDEQTEPRLDRTPMWTLDELCAKVHTTPATVHTWRKRGTAPKAYRIGRHLMFDEADVKAWLEARATAAADEPHSDAGSGW